MLVSVKAERIKSKRPLLPSRTKKKKKSEITKEYGGKKVLYESVFGRRNDEL